MGAARSSGSPMRVLFAVVGPLQAFFRTQAAGGIVLVFVAAFALAWANSAWAGGYVAFIRAPIEIVIAGRSLHTKLATLTNDALMTLFFLTAGLEIKRELVTGELRTFRRALLPAVGALGGMIVPACIYLAIAGGSDTRAGWGIPMATDIAFALGVLSLVKKRVPASLVVLLTALAIFDDLGAIGVIAVFYGEHVAVRPLVAAGLLTASLFALGRANVRALSPYVVLGIGLWIALHAAGVHATLAGVAVGLAIPATPERRAIAAVEDLEEALAGLRAAGHGGVPQGTIAAVERHLESIQAPLDRFANGIHGIVAFGIVPLFALVNAGVTLPSEVSAVLGERVTLGVALGLVVGKAVGVFGATWIAVRLKLSPFPSGASGRQLFGVAVLAGIGFTMSIFVAELAFPGHAERTDAAKVGILGASAVCALLGLLVLRVSRPAVDADEAPRSEVAATVGR